MIKAIIFDIDGVLLDSFEANFKFYNILMTHFGYQGPSRDAYPGLFPLTMWDVIKKLTGLTSDIEIEKIWQAGAKREIFYPFELLRTPNNCLETLELLSKKYVLGIVTSRITSSIFSVPQLAAMKSYFTAVVAYDDTKLHKPSPEPLLLAANKLGILPKEAVYVGDVASDILAAHAAGMKIIAYNKVMIDGADALTADFTKLPEIISGL